ncbi:MAG TPA: hypothetical protein VE464_09440 [Streptosporangiaceae bacterium]|nr:hypothetical protein [Streptosporangiaceae bacterium]
MTDDDGTIESGQSPDPGPLPSFGVAHPAAADPASSPGTPPARSPAAPPAHSPATPPVRNPATPPAHDPQSASLTGATGAGPAVPTAASSAGPAAQPAGTAPPDGTTPPLDIDQITSQVYERIGDKMDHRPDTAQDTPPAEQAIMLRDKAPELYDLWLKIAQEKAATSNYVQRAPYEVPERLAQSGRPRALSAMIVVLAFCGYLASLGGPGPYIGGLIAILDLLVMLALFFGLRPDHLTDSGRPRKRRLIQAGPARAVKPGRPSPGGPAPIPNQAAQPRVPRRTEPPEAGRSRGAQQLPPGLSPAGLPDQHHRNRPELISRLCRRPIPSLSFLSTFIRLTPSLAGGFLLFRPAPFTSQSHRRLSLE